MDSPLRQNQTVHEPVLAVSDGTGSSAEQLIRSMLVQFGDPAVPVIKVPGIRNTEDIARALAMGAAHGTRLVVHTILAPDLRAELERRCAENGIRAIDLVGGMLDSLAERLGPPSDLRPGLYRRLHREYFQRMEAIDYAIKHDDGQNPATLDAAHMVLLGVSRSGKTPLSMFLAMQGWKVANVPLVAGISPPHQLEQLDGRRMVGLLISSELLIHHRAHRQSALGTLPNLYTDPARIFHEVETARIYYRRLHIPTVDVTNKPIESSAREVVAVVTRRLGPENLPGQGL
jgi:[pyruvate, water dikinase]-phosphate phosphotransferase / [pyruvate, water dikinase] kinase